MLVLYYIHIEKRKELIKMRFTAKDYEELKKALDRNKVQIEKRFPQFKSYKEWYKLVYDNACKTCVSDAKLRYVADVFWYSNIIIDRTEYRGYTSYRKCSYVIYTDENYNDAHIFSAIRKYLKDNGLDFYNQ